MKTTYEKNLATFTHLSTLSQYCIPFGNYIFPILIWSTNKDKSEFIDANGKRVLNFQLSLLLYTLILAVIAIPILIFSVFNSVSIQSVLNDQEHIFEHLRPENIGGIVIIAILALFLLACLKIVEFILIIYASIKASNGEDYQYPLTINFIK